MYEINTENTARDELQKFEVPQGVKIDRRHAAILGLMIFTMDKRDLRDERKLTSSLSIAENLGLQWQIQNHHPFVCMASRGNPR